MAEWFMLSGRDALVIYDDLSKHAVAYRAMSLLLRRPPGREAYPGDVFYLHSRLLERAACLSDANGGGSLTALPIVETQAGDISAYIPTNVIFHYRRPDLPGYRPVPRGACARRSTAACRSAAWAAPPRPRRCARWQASCAWTWHSTASCRCFAQFSSDMDAATQDKLHYGELLTEMLRQPNNAPLPMPIQVALLYAGTRGLFPKSAGAQLVRAFKDAFPKYLLTSYPHVVQSLARYRRAERTGRGRPSPRRRRLARTAGRGGRHMSSVAEIRHHIKAVRGTSKITRAMYLISSAKMKKAMRMYEQNLQFFGRVRANIRFLLDNAEGEARNPYFRRHGRCAAFLVIAGDKGMCGGYNNEVLRLAVRTIEDGEHLCEAAVHHRRGGGRLFCGGAAWRPTSRFFTLSRTPTCAAHAGSPRRCATCSAQRNWTRCT